MQVGEIIRTGVQVAAGVLSLARGIDMDLHPRPQQQAPHSVMVAVVGVSVLKVLDERTVDVKRLVTPGYPTKELTQGREGEAVILAIVKPTGAVRRVSVARATSDAFGKSALSAVQQWRFAPLPREVEVQIRILYTPQ